MIDLDVAEFHIGVLDSAGDKSVPVNVAMMRELITRLRQAEKDAARYRWIKENSQFGVGRCGVDWELYFDDGPAPDNSAMIERHIDEAMQCNK